MKYFKIFFLKNTIALVFFFCLVNLSKAQVVINEYSCSNVSSFMCNLGTYEDWIELYNTSSTPVNLTNYYLSNKKTSLTKWQFGNVTIAGNSFLRIWASGYNVTTGINLHTNFTLTQCKPDNIIFSNPSAVVIDSLTLNPAQLAHSRGRTTNGAATWSVFLNPTPATSNAGPKQNYATTPAMNVAPGFYGGTQMVSITSPDPNITIHYTMDGTTPTQFSATYSTPVSISSTTVLRAFAISSTATIPPSFIESNTYFINSPHTVSVVSVFGDQVATLMNGTQSSPETGMQYFDSSGTFRTGGYGTTNKHGNDSWSYPQRGIDFVSYDEYGYSDVLHHRFFNTKIRKDFQRIILKAAANDNYPFECPAAGNPYAWGDPTLFDGAHIRDSYVETVAQKAGMHLDCRTWAPCVMYVNGQYWGVYDLREKVDDKDFTKYYYNSSSDSLQFLQNWGGVWAAYGGNQALTDWTSMTTYITSNNMAVASNYNHVDSLFSIKSFVDYILINSYCVTSDWLNWNSEWWRGTNANCSKKKWRYCLWDEDATFHHYINYTGIPNNNANASPCDPQGLNPSPPDYGGNIDILNALMQNSGFKQYYVLRYFDLINTGLSCVRMTAILDSMVLQIAPEMPRQVSTWGGSVGAWQQNVLNLRNFILARCDSISHQFDSCYNTTGPYNIKVNVDPPGAGTVDFNSLHLTSFIWSGVYPGNMTVSLTEHPNPNYCFSHWEFKNNTPLPNNLDSSITVNLHATDSIIAHYIYNAKPTILPANPQVCAGDSIQLTASGGTSYVWAPSSTLSCSTCASPYAHPAVTTIYTVTSVNAPGCLNTNSQIVTVLPPDPPIISPLNPKFCIGDSVKLTASGGISYSWTPSSNLSCSICPSPYAHPSATTIYTVTATNGSGCVNKNSQTVTVLPYATANFADTTTGIGLPQSVNFYSTSTLASSYSWNFGNGFTATGANPTYSYTVAGTYSVTMIAINSSGCNDTITKIIVITDTVPTPGISMPNFFSPNGDGINEYFQPIAHGVTDFSCTIFDRWGKVIYDFSGINDKWNGQNTQGANVPDGTYYYIVKAKDTNAKSYNFKGFLQLVR